MLVHVGCTLLHNAARVPARRVLAPKSRLAGRRRPLAPGGRPGTAAGQAGPAAAAGHSHRAPVQGRHHTLGPGRAPPSARLQGGEHMGVWQPSKGVWAKHGLQGGGQNLQNKSIRTIKRRDEAKNGNRYPVARLGNRHCGHYKARLK